MQVYTPDTYQPTDTDLDSIRSVANSLLEMAVMRGISLTITEEPVEPLRMGNKVPVIRVERMTATYRKQLAATLTPGNNGD